MAVRKFIKMYNIRNEDIDDKGNVNPDAALYPYYATYTKGDGGKRYADVSPDDIVERLSSEDFAYDNSDNSFTSRTAKLYEWNGDEGGPRKSTQIGPNMKRGFSALAYANKDKRHGDDYLRDDADAWQDWQSPIRHAEHIPLDRINVLKEATRRGGAFDWYDSSTYSDERMKDIYNGWRDVILSDKLLKHIYDDFRNFKRNATQNSIMKGVRGLGQ